VSENLKIDWKKMNGLVPAVVQDADSHQVLMMAYVNEAAMEKTLSSGEVTFYSRSKERLWTKGEESGNKLKFVSANVDCDGDALLITARPMGPTCHTGDVSCFSNEKIASLAFLSELQKIIESRKASAKENNDSASYTVKLFREGIDRIAQKVGEEAIETVIASKNENREQFLGEASDLVFHLMILLSQKGVNLEDVTACLQARHKK
jgi:phosphoribosyl-ATP pyrophosphohydrolase/phosphoribosyl-AMP cyclohydrolase